MPPQHACGGQGTAVSSQLSPSTLVRQGPSSFCSPYFRLSDHGASGQFSFLCFPSCNLIASISDARCHMQHFLLGSRDGTQAVRLARMASIFTR